MPKQNADAVIGFRSGAIVVSIVASLAVGQAHAERPDRSSASVSQADQKFLEYAAEDNQAEIQPCLLAEKRAQNPALKAFARLMVDDHVEIESRLAAVGSELRTELPDGMGKEGEAAPFETEAAQGG
jgi:putative membrane protein